MSTGAAMMLAWLIGMLCGAAWMASFRYAVALTTYVGAIVGTHLLGIPANNGLTDAFIVVGVLLLCFGVARGLTAMIWQERSKTNADTDEPVGGKPAGTKVEPATLQAGRRGTMPLRASRERPKPRTFV